MKLFMLATDPKDTLKSFFVDKRYFKVQLIRLSDPYGKPKSLTLLDNSLAYLA